MTEKLTSFLNFCSGCSPKKIWMLVRHGTRNPSSSVIVKIKDRLPKIKELIIENDRLPNGKYTAAKPERYSRLTRPLSRFH